MAGDKKPVKPRKTNKGIIFKTLDKRQIEKAMSETRSNLGAARYCSVHLDTYKKYASMYKDEHGVSLYEKHKNMGGKGISKGNISLTKRTGLMDILCGDMRQKFVSPKELKRRLIKEGYLPEKCAKCGFDEKRQLDFKVPVILHFKDGDKKNWFLDNLEFLCYNHYFIMVGEIFEENQIRAMEEFSMLKYKTIDFELPPAQKEAVLKSLNLDSRKSQLTVDPPKDENYGDDLISYRKF